MTDDDEDPLHVDLADIGNGGGDFGGEPCAVVRGVAFTHPARDQHRVRLNAVGVQAVGRQIFVSPDMPFAVL
jgi:hypothetical protein